MSIRNVAVQDETPAGQLCQQIAEGDVEASATALWRFCWSCHFITGWWFQTFFIFPYIRRNIPNWLIFFRVQTTNQIMISRALIGIFMIFLWGYDRWPTFRKCHIATAHIRANVHGFVKLLVFGGLNRQEACGLLRARPQLAGEAAKRWMMVG